MTTETQKRPIRALTIFNPWAALIAEGVKRVENRTWSPERQGLRVGDFLAIHASGFKPGRGGTAEEWGAAAELAERAGILDEVPLLAEFVKVVDVPRQERGRLYLARCKHHVEHAVPYSAIVAVAVVADVVRAAPLRGGRPDPWFVGPVGWVLEDVVKIDPIPCKGAQGIWTIEEHILGELRFRYKMAVARRSQGG